VATAGAPDGGLSALPEQRLHRQAQRGTGTRAVDPRGQRQAVRELRELELAHTCTLGATARVAQPSLLDFPREQRRPDAVE
jgi:hypothetical protein